MRPLSPDWDFGGVGVAAEDGGLWAGGANATTAAAGSDGVGAPMPVSAAESRLRVRPISPAGVPLSIPPAVTGWKGGTAPNAGVPRGGLGWYAGMGDPSLAIPGGPDTSAIMASPNSAALSPLAAPSKADLLARLAAERIPTFRSGFQSSSEDSCPLGSIDAGVNLEGV